MAVGQLLQIDNVTPPKLRGFTVSREKLFSEAGRNLKGELKATFLGIFPKLKLRFAPTTQSEMSQLIELLDPASISVEWWDEDTDSVKTADFYAGSYDIPLLKKSDGYYDEFEVNLISYNKLA